MYDIRHLLRFSIKTFYLRKSYTHVRILLLGWTQILDLNIKSYHILPRLGYGYGQSTEYLLYVILEDLLESLCARGLRRWFVHRCIGCRIRLEQGSWQDLIEMKKEHLKQIESEAIILIKEKMKEYQEYTSIIPVSMGKDSMLTCYLVRSLYPDTKAVFNNTTLDCKDTYRMAKRFSNCEIMNPRKGFYEYVESHHMIPNRRSRFCCRIFKTGVMVSKLNHNHPYLLWMGMRNDESLTRKAYEDVWVNKAEWGNDTCWKGILPIRKWTELDVWLYTVWKKIPVNLKYKKGYSRVGCHCACPYYSKSTWTLDKYWYPNGYQRWREILKKDFIENKKWLVMNCTLDEYLTQAWNGGTFRNVPTEQVIDEFAMYTGIHKEVAVQYFNKTCCRCGKTRIKQRDVLSMNLKLHGRNVNKFYCKKCLMEQYHWTSENWNQQVNAFKKQGCDLF